MDLNFSERAAIKGIQCAMQRAVEIFFIQPRYELREFLLRHRGRQVNIPCGQAGESF